MRPPDTIRFGILGTSRVAKKSAIPALLSSSGAKLVMIGSRSKERARQWGEEFGCASGTYEDVLANPDVDAVYISLPNSMHEEWAVKAASAGKHVWCEKPAALSYASAKRIVESCRKNGVRVIEGFAFLYHPQHATVQRLIEDGSFGDLLRFEGCFSYPAPEASNIRLDKSLGGGSYADAAVYPIRASRMLFNEEPISVACNFVMDQETGVDSKADMLLVYSGKRSAFVSSAFGAYFQSSYSLLGEKAYLKMQRAYAVPKEREVMLYIEADDKREDIVISAADQFVLMLEEFCREILLGAESKKVYEKDLLAQARIFEAGLISNWERRVVLLSEIN